MVELLGTDRGGEPKKKGLLLQLWYCDCGGSDNQKSLLSLYVATAPSIQLHSYAAD